MSENGPHGEKAVDTACAHLNAVTYNAAGLDRNAIPRGLLTLFGDYQQRNLDNFPRQNHGQRILPTWQRLSARKRLQLSYRELLGALGDLSEQHTQSLERHNALAVAYEHLQLELRALRRLADAAAYRRPRRQEGLTYKELLERDPGWFDEVVRATGPRRLPAMLTRPGVAALLAALDGVAWVADFPRDAKQH